MSAENTSKQPQKKLKSMEKESTTGRDKSVDDQEVCKSKGIGKPMPFYLGFMQQRKGI